MKNEIVPIFYATDDGFAKYTAVSLYSMSEHASKEREYRIHILFTSLSEDSKSYLRSASRPGFEVQLVDVRERLDKICERLPIRDYYTKTTYYRLFIADAFPEYKKAIYIDGDTVVRRDIAELYDTDIGDNMLGACHEHVMSDIKIYGDYCEEVVGISRYAFFNAGLLLINCSLWREIGLFERFLKLLGEYNFVVTQDEDYLNVLAKDRVYYLDSRWNTEVTAGLEYPYDPAEEAYILHYIMANKPWKYENPICGDIFWEAAGKTPLYGIIREQLAGYTDADRAKDAECAASLAELARSEIENENNYRRMLDAKKHSADRVKITERIREYERDGRFDEDVEDDPPSRTLLPSEIDYLRRSPVAKIKTFISYRMAKSFLDKIIKNGDLIIKEIRGIENLQKLDTGAIITANHFNPFDTFAIHKAFLESGIKSKKLYRVIREGNYTSFPGFYGYLMRNFYTLPLSSDRRTMRKFSDAVAKLLSDGNLILVYPEQSLWWNYRKPKPLKSGAYSLAAKNGVPILPMFITMRDTDRTGDDGYPIQEYTIHIEKPIYPDTSLYMKDAVAAMMEENRKVWQEIYEREYSMPLVYTTKNSKE